jgi:DNA-binding winged helix-turn-helix (wHTH) protein/Tol biopolymer transport system component
MAVNTPDVLFRFGVFEVEPRSGEVRKGGSRIKLQDQPFKVLLVLLEHPGEVITREELRARIWPNDSFGDFDHAVNVAVAKLRNALGDSADMPRYVETLPRRGYRFIFPLTEKGPLTEKPGLRRADGAEKAEALTEGSVAGPAGVVQTRRAKLLIVAVVAVVVVTAALLGFKFARHKPKSPASSATNLHIERVTNSGNVAYVAISPDGRFLVYASRDGKLGLGLWMRVLGTQTEAQILPPAKRDFRGVTFSPDGTQLFFPRSSAKDQSYRDLFSMPIVGGEPRLLIKNVDSPISFSADGRNIVFMRKNSARNTVDVMVAKADGSGEHSLLTFDQAGGGWQNGAAWSPDGRTVVVSVTFWSMRNESELNAISVSNGTVKKIYASGQIIGRPVWLPEGDGIVAAMQDQNDHYQLWLIPYPQGEPRLITHDLEDYHEYIDGTRDGKTIAAIGWKTINNIFVFPANDPSRGKQITFGEQDIDSATVLSNGRVLIHESGNPDGELWTMNGDGSQRTPFSNLKGIGFVSRCGPYVIFLTTENHKTSLVRTDVDGLHPQILTTGGLWSPYCSSSGDYVYYADWVMRPQGLFRISIQGGEPERIGQVPGKQLIGTVTISPDGNFLAFPYQDEKDEARSTLIVIPSTGGPPTKAFPDVWGLVKWSPNGRCIVHYDVLDDVVQLVEQPLVGGKPRQLTKFLSGRSEDFSWSPDGKWLYIAHGEVRSDAVLISNFR